MNYLGFDLETGGFDKKEHTINEAYFAIWDENWEFKEDLHLLLKNDKGEIHGTEEAYKITNIDPEEHLANPETITYTEGRTKLLAMLERHKIPRKRSHYRLLGQNIVYFDIPFMDEQGFLSEKQSKKAGINHNALDTTCLITCLKDIGMLPSNVGSIGSLIDFFGLPKGTAHSAKGDVHMQKAIYIKLVGLLRQAQQNNLTNAGGQSDLLKIVEF
jgi:hypothetical protein